MKETPFIFDKVIYVDKTTRSCDLETLYLNVIRQMFNDACYYLIRYDGRITPIREGWQPPRLLIDGASREAQKWFVWGGEDLEIACSFAKLSSEELRESVFEKLRTLNKILPEEWEIDLKAPSQSDLNLIEKAHYHSEHHLFPQ